jgi:hypothetical protein
MKMPLLLLAAVAVVLALTNPSEADFREHVRQKEGVAGTVGMAVADLLTGGKKGGVNRDNYLIASRFYLGGDGILPREDIAWGIAGFFIETK